MPLSSNSGPGTVSPFEEEEQVQGTVATCPVSCRRFVLGHSLDSVAAMDSVSV